MIRLIGLVPAERDDNKSIWNDWFMRNWADGDVGAGDRAGDRIDVHNEIDLGPGEDGFNDWDEQD